MADQLFEIINTSLNKTQLNAGDHTILTTDANTSYVIKDLYVSSNNASIPVSLTLKVNDVPSGTFTDNASGTEIIPPNSVVKVKSSAFPLSYQDTTAVFHDNTGTYGVRKFSDLSVSGISDPTLSGSTFTPTSSFSDYTSNETNYTIKFLNATGTRLITFQKDNNSVTNLYVRGTGGTHYQETTGYAPKAYDGSRWAYWYAEPYVYRVDLTLNDPSSITFQYVPAGTQTTYARSWMSSGLNQAFMFNVGAGNHSYALDLATFTYWNMGSISGLYGTNLNIASSWDAVNNQYNIAFMRTLTQCDIYTVKTGQTVVFQKSVNLPLTVSSDRGSFYMEDRKVIYMNSDNLYSVDVDSLIVVKLLTVGAGNYSNDMFIYSKSIPSAETIASRTYSINPAFSVRAVGIKTT